MARNSGAYKFEKRRKELEKKKKKEEKKAARLARKDDDEVTSEIDGVTVEGSSTDPEGDEESADAVE